MERVPTGESVFARGRDDFHIVVRTSFTSSLISFVSGNPTVGTVNVVTPADSFCNVKVWTR